MQIIIHTGYNQQAVTKRKKKNKNKTELSVLVVNSVITCNRM